MDFLPIPKPEHVARFQAVYLEEFGVDLEEKEALQLLTQLSQLVYIKEGDALRAVRSQEQR